MQDRAGARRRCARRSRPPGRARRRGRSRSRTAAACCGSARAATAGRRARPTVNRIRAICRVVRASQTDTHASVWPPSDGPLRAGSRNSPSADRERHVHARACRALLDVEPLRQPDHEREPEPQAGTAAGQLHPARPRRTRRRAATPPTSRRPSSRRPGWGGRRTRGRRRCPAPRTPRSRRPRPDARTRRWRQRTRAPSGAAARCSPAGPRSAACGRGTPSASAATGAPWVEWGQPMSWPSARATSCAAVSPGVCSAKPLLIYGRRAWRRARRRSRRSGAAPPPSTCRSPHTGTRRRRGGPRDRRSAGSRTCAARRA